MRSLRGCAPVCDFNVHDLDGNELCFGMESKTR